MNFERRDFVKSLEETDMEAIEKWVEGGCLTVCRTCGDVHEFGDCPERELD